MLQGNWQPPSHSYHVHVFSDIELWCFSFVTLFNLQGTRPAPLCRGTFTILLHSLEFVKYFFRLFSKSFFVPARSCESLDSFAILPHSFELVKPFLNFFQSFFGACLALQVSLRKLDYLNTSAPVCQPFFSLSRKLFSSPCLLLACVRQLA